MRKNTSQVRNCCGASYRAICNIGLFVLFCFLIFVFLQIISFALYQIWLFREKIVSIQENACRLWEHWCYLNVYDNVIVVMSWKNSKGRTCNLTWNLTQDLRAKTWDLSNKRQASIGNSDLTLEFMHLHCNFVTLMVKSCFWLVVRTPLTGHTGTQFKCILQSFLSKWRTNMAVQDGDLQWARPLIYCMYCIVKRSALWIR